MKVKYALSALSATLLFASCSSNQMKMNSEQELAVITVETSSADLNTAYPATIEGQEVTEIRAKVSGHITKVFVKEGQSVSRGQALFQIDATQYQAQVQQAQAAVNLVNANISTQKLTVNNKKALHDKQIISDYDYQMAVNQLAALEAQLEQAKATLTAARDQLSFCTVTSPTDGVCGEIGYRVGSLVGPTAVTPLTTVASVSNVYVYFSMTEKQILAMSRECGTVEKAIAAMPPVTLKLSDGSTYENTGKIAAISGVVDATTGAVQIRADFQNPTHLLRSGGTGTVLIPTHEDAAIVIPQSATYKIQEKIFCYVVGADDTVKNTEIVVLQQEDGSNYVVTSGLKVGDRIIIEGVNKVKDGDKIKPITPEESAKQLDKAKQHMAEKKMPNE